MPITLSNRALTARFDSTTGSLIHLSKSGRGKGVVIGSHCRYMADGQWFGRTYFGAPSDHELPAVITHDDRTVTVAYQSPHAQIVMTYTLEADASLLKVHSRVVGRGVDTPLTYLGTPHIDFAPSFNDAFEDEVDLFSDGAELARGSELPCWRVLFRKGRKEGVIFATRSKADMSHMNILARGFDIEPHIGLNYSNHNVPVRPPLDASKRRAHEVRFEIGPWSREGHDALLKAAKLEKPHSVDHPRAAGKPVAKSKLKGKVFHAAQLATSRISGKQYKADRWMIADMPWSQSGKALFATTGVKPPPLKFDPKLTGLHRMYIGIGDSQGVTLKIDGDPHRRYRLVSETRGLPEAFSPALSGKHTSREVDFGVVDLTGRKIEVGRFPVLNVPATIDYIRCEPLTASQQRQWHREESLDPRLPLSGLADTPDISILVDAQDPDPDVIDSIIWEHANAKVNKCYWRVDGQCSDFPSKHNTMRYISAKVHGVYQPQAKAYGRLLRKVDVLQRAADAAREYGVSLWAWMRFNNYTGNVQSDFFKNNPQYWEESEAGYKGRKICIAHPAVRKHKIDILIEACKYGLDGINLGFLRHPPVLLNAKVMCDAYERKFGSPPPCDPDHPDPHHTKSLPKRKNQKAYTQWWTFRAGYLTTFARELKAALKKNNLDAVKIAAWVRPNHCLFDGIDLPTWLDEGLCDEVVTMHYSSLVHDRELNWERPQWKKMVQARVPLIRTIEPWNSPADTHNDVKRIVRDGYDGLCTYESNDTVMDTRFIQLYRSLRK